MAKATEQRRGVLVDAAAKKGARVQRVARPRRGVPGLCRPVLSLLLACAVSGGAAAQGAEAASGIEQALQAARQAQRGVTLYVNGQPVAGAVVRVETGSGAGWVELRSQQHSRIVVRIDRIDAIAQP